MEAVPLEVPRPELVGVEVGGKEPHALEVLQKAEGILVLPRDGEPLAGFGALVL